MQPLETPTATESGRRRSSANSRRLHLLTKIVVLEGESANVFSQFFDEHLHRLNPADGVEYAVVEEVVAAAWRLRRVWQIETTLLNNAAKRSTADSRAGRSADAFADLGARNQLQLVDRYETRMTRLYQRALTTLKQLREFPQVKPYPEPNEPVFTRGDATYEEIRGEQAPAATPENDILPNEPSTDLNTNPTNDLPPNIPTPIPLLPNHSKPAIPIDTSAQFRPFRLPDLS